MPQPHAHPLLERRFGYDIENVGWSLGYLVKNIPSLIVGDGVEDVGHSSKLIARSLRKLTRFVPVAVGVFEKHSGGRLVQLLCLSIS